MTRFEFAKRIRESSVNPTAKAIGAALAARWIEDKQFTAVKASVLAAELGRSRKTVLRALNDLEQAGIIQKQKTTRASLYKASPLPEHSSEQELLEETKMSTLKDHSGHNHKINSSWRDYYPELAGMTDEDFAAMCADNTRQAQLATLTGWDMRDLVGLHPDWIAAQLSTLTLTMPDRNDGINGSRLLDLAPEWQISKQDDGESTKYWEAIHGYKRPPVLTIVRGQKCPL